VRTPELFDLSGRTALVTGGGRGIGRYIALGLAEAGADVCVVGRSLEHCEQSAAAVRACGRRAWALSADLSKLDAIEALVDAVLSETPKLDILVNNAARVWAAPTLDYPPEGWDRVFDLNVRGLFFLSQRVARNMAEHGGGSIIHVSSISAFRGAPDEEQAVVAYNASKGAVVSLTIDMATKLAPLGIRVNGIAPGPFLTDMMNHLRHDEQRMHEYNRGIPLGRCGEEDDIKGAAVFLASDASKFVTGHTLTVDGGVLTVYPTR
jgi:NAD(P)-dependent dehydrogenase (short-subunit alcohol dehydrogenase family)